MSTHVEIVELIRTVLERRGSGTEDSPYRTVEQWWTKGGELVFEKDPHEEERIRSLERNVREVKPGQVIEMDGKHFKWIPCTAEGSNLYRNHGAIFCDKCGTKLDYGLCSSCVLAENGGRIA